MLKEKVIATGLLNSLFFSLEQKTVLNQENCDIASVQYSDLITSLGNVDTFQNCLCRQ